MYILIYLITILLIVSILYLFLLFPRIKKPEYHEFTKWHYAHRGFHNNDGDAPENSIRAFELAVKNNYGIELDVQLTKDDKLVVFHDCTLKRVCGIDGKISEYNYDELQKFNLCYSNESIPLFSDVLAKVNGKVPLIIEIKFYTNIAHVCEKTMECLKDYKGLYCVESFNPMGVAWFRKHYPNILRGQLSSNFKEDYKNNETSGRKYDLAAFCTRHLLSNFLARPDFIAYNHKYKNSISRRICKLLGSVGVTWTIHTHNDMKKCYDDFDMFIFQDFKPTLPTKNN